MENSQDLCANSNRKCFVCGNDKTELYSIFEIKLNSSPASSNRADDDQEENATNLAEMLSRCTRYNFKHFDEFPQQICALCIKLAQAAFKFIRKVEDSICQLTKMSQMPITLKTPNSIGNILEKSTQTTESFCNSQPKHCELNTCQAHPRCEICQKTFSRNDHLRRHMRTVHKDILESSILEEPEIELKTKIDDAMLLSNTCDEANYSTSNKCALETIQEGPHSINPISIDEKQNVSEELFASRVKVEANDFDLLASTLGYESSNRTREEGKNELSCLLNKNQLEIIDANTSNILIEAKHLLDDISRNQRKENCCHQCQRTFSRYSHLQRHMLTHSAEKPHVCSHCGKQFARTDHLQKHIRNLHNEKKFKCPLCSRAFIHEQALQLHIDSRHSDTDKNSLRKHKCEQCGKKFLTKSYLNKHKQMHEDSNFTCKVCEKSCMNRKELREHEKTHGSERNFLCSVCGESFQRKDYLVVHMRRHSGEKPYKCQFCGKGFPRATDVKMHERYHTGTKPNLCTLCGKRFHRPFNLTTHMRTHTGERPYKCDKCPKTFTQSNDLKAHIRRHTGERYKCTECDANFLQLYILRKHAFSAHGIHMEPTTGRLQKFPQSSEPKVIDAPKLEEDA